MSPEVVRAIADAQASRLACDPTTLRALLRQWRPNSAEWQRLADTTKKTWGSQLDLIEDKWGDTPLAFWNDPRMVAKVVAWRDSRAATPRSADIGVTVLRTLLEFGRLRGRIHLNVAQDIPTLYRNGQRAEIVWLDEDLERFVATANELGAAHIADGARLAALTGLRRADLVSLRWDEVQDHAIVKRAAKRSAGKRRFATMPLIPALSALLSDLRHRERKPGVETVLVNSYGEPWTGDGFSGSFIRIRDAAAIVHVDPETGQRASKRLHDLRGTFCTRLMTQTDLSDREVAEIMGWSPDRVAGIRKLYVDQTEMVKAMGKRMHNRHLGEKLG